MILCKILNFKIFKLERFKWLLVARHLFLSFCYLVLIFMANELQNVEVFSTSGLIKR